MKLSSSFIRLPHRFDAEAVRREIASLPDSAWTVHSGQWVGHQQMPLVTVDGHDDLNKLEGPMRPTQWLARLPMLQHLLLALDTVLGRSLLLRVEPGAEPKTLVDAGYYWHRRLRIFLPIQAAGCRWHCGAESIEMPAGEVWTLNGWGGYRHEVSGDEPLLCLISDTVGSASFWSTIKTADRPLEPGREQGMSPRQINLATALARELEIETVRFPRVMSPFELETLIDAVMDELRSSAPKNVPHLPKLEASLEQFVQQWQGIHARFGDDEQGRPAYRQALEQLLAQAAIFSGVWRLANGLDSVQMLYQTVVQSALRDEQGRPVVVLKSRQAAPGTKKENAASPQKSPPAAGDAIETVSPAQPPQVSPEKSDKASADTAALRSVHTKSLPQILQQTASSLLVTTYQAGKLVICRENEGKLNTHFMVSDRPMGLAVDAEGRLAMGTRQTVGFYRNMPDLAARLEPKDRHDVAFLPRRNHVTGQIDIHEMDWAGDELWLVNTRFSCLCTLDDEYSFVPRWRPPFISGYAAEDRCHLNGLEVVDGKPKYVTALGTSDLAGGWRENKAGGGILMDVESNEILCRSLSMPHSPRWYQDKLWVLESGNGSLATVDLDTGQVETVAELPGFTRGLDFLGPFAFIGLSQVRESAVFSGISLTERVNERSCGVWVVDIRTGQSVAFLKFEDAVQEVFAVSVLPGIRFPEVLAANNPYVGLSYALPDNALKEVIHPDPKGEGG